MKIHLIFLALVMLAGTSFAQEEEQERSWNISASSRFMSRYSSYGLDLSNDRAALGYDVTLAHAKGFSLVTGALQTLGTGGELQQWFASVEYEWKISESFALSGEYKHYTYTNDSVNVLATLTNGLSFSAELSLDVVDVGFSYDTFLGSNSASYFGFDLSSFFQLGDISVVPLAQVTFMSQDVENRLLKGNKLGIGRGGPPLTSAQTTSSVTSVTGLGSFSAHVIFIYPILENLSLSFHPSYQYSPKAEVSARSSQVILSTGLRYSFDF